MKSIKFVFGDPGKTPEKGVVYTGDFPWGEWTARSPGVFCQSMEGGVRCVVAREGPPPIITRVVGLVRMLYCDLLPFYNGLVMHASSIALFDQKGVAFVAPSGGGKSTISQMLPGKLLSDDFTPIYLTDGGPVCLASPFVGWEKQRAQQESASLVAIYRLFKGKHWTIQDMNQLNAIRFLLENVISFARVPAVKQAILDRVIDFSGVVAVRRLGFSLSRPKENIIHELAR